MLDKEVREKFKIFQKSEEGRKYRDLEIDDVRFKEISLADDKYFEFVKGKNHYIKKYNLANKGKYPLATGSVKNESIAYNIKPINNSDITNKKCISFNKDGDSQVFYRDYDFLMDRHHIAIVPTDDILAKYLYFSIIPYFRKMKFGWGENIADAPTVSKHSLPIPQDLDKTYTSFKIQEAIVAFLEASFEKNQRIRENIDKRYELFKRLDKALIPSTFKRDYVKVAFGRYAKEHGIGFEIMDVEFVNMPLSNISKIIKAGGTPKRKIKDYWTSLDNINGYPWLDIDRKEFQSYSINDYREKITKEGLNSSSTWVVPRNSIMITIGGSLGYVALNNIEVCTNQNILNVVLKKEYISKYVMYNLENFYQKNIRSQKSSYGNLSKRSEEVRIIKIPKSLTNYSSYEVQQIISDFIEAMQTKIQKEFSVMDEGYDALKLLHKTYLARTFTLIDWEAQ